MDTDEIYELIEQIRERLTSIERRLDHAESTTRNHELELSDLRNDIRALERASK